MDRPTALICVLLLVCGACTPPPGPAGVTQAPVQAAGEPQFQALWHACLEVLRQHRFQIDRRDLRAGVITTFPETSQALFEFWRHDVDTPYDLAESSLHTMRRTAVVQLSKTGEGEGDYRVEVTVSKERHNTAERQINNAAGAFQMYSTLLPDTRGRKIGEKTASRWIPLGRDGAMEQRLLEQILENFRQRSSG